MNLLASVRESSDFWWIRPSQRRRYQYAEFGHHVPIRDDEEPGTVNWDTNICSIDKLGYWRCRFRNTNVYRTLKITTASLGEEEIIGPFLIDIDNGYEDLEDAQSVTRKTLYLLRDEFKVGIDSFRIFFTGHKGFNIEILPQELDIQGSLYDQIRKSAYVLHQKTEALRRGKSWETINQVSNARTVVDQIYGNRYSGYRLKHPYIRLHGSVNTWISPDGKTKARTKTELAIHDIDKLPATEIASRAERLAI